jgi:hypothetical protein
MKVCFISPPEPKEIIGSNSEFLNVQGSESRKIHGAKTPTRDGSAFGRAEHAKKDLGPFFGTLAEGGLFFDNFRTTSFPRVVVFPIPKVKKTQL